MSPRIVDRNISKESRNKDDVVAQGLQPDLRLMSNKVPYTCQLFILQLNNDVKFYKIHIWVSVFTSFCPFVVSHSAGQGNLKLVIS